MISHAPEATEKLQDFGIPVMIEYSSYESHPLGRVEWVKFFGALLGKEEEAEQIFAEQKAILDRVTADENTGKTVAFFFITSNGLVQVRQPSDYVPKMIDLAGGCYIFDNLGVPQTKRSTVNMQVEELYQSAKDADFLIYNSSIDGGISSMEELFDKCDVLKDFNAVKEGNVWCTTNGRAFIAGIIFENDLDYPAAKALAAEIIVSKAFEPIPQGLLEEAKCRLDTCTSVICCKKTFGSLDKANEELLVYAKTKGKTIETVEVFDKHEFYS